MENESPRFGLPFLVPGQAQKEHFHNEALVRLDALVSASVEGVEAAPPLAPAEGRMWIVAAPAAAAWAGQEHSLACWTAGGWRFLAPVEGHEVWNKAAEMPWRWLGGAWTAGEIKGSAIFVGGEKVVGARAPAVPSPSGGTIIDAEARAAVDKIIVALMSHGLIE